MATDNHVMRVTDLSEVQSEVLQRAIQLAKEHNISYQGKLRAMLALEGYWAEDIEAAFMFWVDQEASLSDNKLRR